MKAGMCMAFFAMLFFTAFIHASSDIPNFSSDLNSTSAYVNTINQSGYLVFYPNLTASYEYIAQARNQSNGTIAYSLLLKARASALAQQKKIYSYKLDSQYLLIATTIILMLLLYVFMRRP